MIDCSFMNLNMILSLLLFLASVLIPFVQAVCTPGQPLAKTIEMMLHYALFFNVGCLFITGCAGQFLYAPEISYCIGWSWSPFQYELAFSELGLGILGLLCPLFHREFQLATIISAAIWFLGASAVHVYYLIAQGNTAILNASFVIGWNIFIAVWLVGLYLIVSRSWSRFAAFMGIVWCSKESLIAKSERL